MNVQKTYTPLSQIPGAPIGMCSAILPNKMQCWRSGDVLCETETETKNLETGESITRVTQAQFCNAHARIEKELDDVERAEAAAAQEEAPTQKEAPKPASTTQPAPVGDKAATPQALKTPAK